MNHIADNAGALLQVVATKIKAVEASKPEQEIEKEEEVVEVRAVPTSLKDMNKLLMAGVGGKKGSKGKGKKGAAKKAKKQVDKLKLTEKPKPVVVEEPSKPEVLGELCMLIYCVCREQRRKERTRLDNSQPVLAVHIG